MGVKLVSASGGSVELVAPTTASNFALTVPANNGTVITTASTFAGTGPAFSAYASVNQSVTNATFTKVQLNTKEFDTNNNYDNTTNYRFTPTVAGYYQVNSSVAWVSQTNGGVKVYKNGTAFKASNYTSAATNSVWSMGFGAIIYLNGTTDYLELYAIQNSGTTVSIQGSQDGTYFQASLVRAA